MTWNIDAALLPMDRAFTHSTVRSSALLNGRRWVVDVLDLVYIYVDVVAARAEARNSLSYRRRQWNVDVTVERLWLISGVRYEHDQAGYEQWPPVHNPIINLTDGTVELVLHQLHREHSLKSSRI